MRRRNPRICRQDPRDAGVSLLLLARRAAYSRRSWAGYHHAGSGSDLRYFPGTTGPGLVDGTVDIEAIEEILSTLRFGSEEDRNYQILANFVLEQLGRIPEEGEMFEAHGWHLEIIDMDRPRIDKVLLRAVKWAGLG